MGTYLQGSQTTTPKPGQSISLMYSHSLLSQTQAGAVRPPHNAIKVTKANTKTLFMILQSALINVSLAPIVMQVKKLK